MKQETALNILKTGKNVFLTGEPGAGKTHTINEYVKYLRSHAIQPAICASTGIAATHIGGMTIHSWAGIGIAPTLSTNDIHTIANRDSVQKRIKDVHILIIDEISMLPTHVLAHVNSICQTVKKSAEPFGGMQVVFVGDFFQLPPITQGDTKKKFAYESSAWELANPTICYLSEQHRQEDKQFLAFLNKLRTSTYSESDIQNITKLTINKNNIPHDIPHLYTHNKNVDYFNNQKLAQLPGTTNTYTMHTKGSKKRVETLIRGCLSPEKLHLKVGATVMFTKNDIKKTYVNGTLGTVIGYDNKNQLPIVKTKKGETITVYPVEWNMEERGTIKATIAQLPLRLAWAITIHKSQGMSMDAAVMDLSGVFEYGQGYVALSRIRTLKGLFLLGHNEQTFQIHPDVFNQDKLFHESSNATEKSHTTNSDEHDLFIFKCGGTVATAKYTPKKIKLKEKTPTRDITLKLWKQNKTIPEIASQRGLQITSIMKHIEDMVESKKLSRDEVFKRLVTPELKKQLKHIHLAFNTCKTEKLTPVQRHLKKTLKKEFSFADLRIARLFIE